MATPMCVSEDGNKATFIGTFLESGDNVRLCDECMPNFCAAVFERMTGVDMTPALYLASVEGQENPDGPPGQPGEVAYPPDMEPHGMSDVDPTGAVSGPTTEITTAEGAPSDGPPAPGPADTDQGAQDPTPAPGAPPESGRTPTPPNGSEKPGASAEGPPDGRSGESDDGV